MQLNEQEFGIIVEETNELLDLDNLQIDKIEKIKTMQERQAKAENQENFKITEEIDTILNSKDPISALTGKS